MMIGNDIVKIDRMQKIYENERLLNRIFTKLLLVYFSYSLYF